MPAYSFQTLRESGYFRFKVVEPLWKWKFRASRLKRLENSEILTPNFTPWNNSWNWLRPCYQISYDFQTSCYFFALSDSYLTLLQGSITSSFLTVLVRLSCYNKIWQVGQFKQQNFIFHHFRRQEMQNESDSFFFFPCWNFSFRLEEVCMSSCFILIWQKEREINFSLVAVFIRALIPSWVLYTHDLITSQKSPSSNTIEFVPRASPYEFWDNTNISPIALTIIQEKM